MAKLHWLDTLPEKMGLREEELHCRPGDVGGATRILNLLRDFYTERGAGLTLYERTWLRAKIRAWRRRVDSPSDWFMLHGDRPTGRLIFSQEFREDACLLKVDAILRYYEGRSRVKPAAVLARIEERREQARNERKKDRIRAKEIAVGLRKPRPRVQWHPITDSDPDLAPMSGQRVKSPPEDAPTDIERPVEELWLRPYEREGIMREILRNTRQSRVK